MSTVETLRKARDHIAKPGQWYQGNWSPSGTRGAIHGHPCCALGACVWALGAAFEKDAAPAWDTLDRVVCAADDDFDEVSDWNDAPGRTQEEVVALFDRAIALAEQDA